MTSSDDLRTEGIAAIHYGAETEKLGEKSSTYMSGSTLQAQDSSPVDYERRFWPWIFSTTLASKLAQVGFVLAYLITHAYEVLPGDIVAMVYAVIGTNLTGIAVLVFCVKFCVWMGPKRDIPKTRLQGTIIAWSVPFAVAGAVHIVLGVLLVLRTKDWQHEEYYKQYKFAFLVSIGELLQGGFDTVYAVIMPCICNPDNEEQEGADNNRRDDEVETTPTVGTLPGYDNEQIPPMQELEKAGLYLLSIGVMRIKGKTPLRNMSDYG